MNFPRVQFVSMPDVTADVRFDFNSVGEWSDYDVWPGHDAFTLGAPSLQGEAGTYGVEYGTRKLTFNLVIQATKVVAAGIMSRLARELITRRTNWLLFQLSAFSQPVWFKTYRTAPDSLDFENVLDTTNNSGDFWGIGVTLEAEPFAYGALVTLPTVTIYNDPNSATTACRAVLPAIIGDAPAPVKIKAAFNVDMIGRRMRFTMTPYEAGYAPAAGIIWPLGTGDAFGGFDDTTVVTGTYSGGSTRRVTFATITSLIRRIEGTVPSNLAPGQYRIFMRISREDSNSTFTIAFAERVGTVWTAAAYGPPFSFLRTASANNLATWMDLGSHNFPNGIPQEVLPLGKTNVSPYIRIDAGRLSGANSLDMDAILAIPEETVRSDPSTVLITDYSDAGPKTTEFGYWDGDEETYVTYVNSNGAIASTVQPSLSGSYLSVTPGADNVLHWLLQTSITAPNSGDNSDVLNTYSNVTLSYYPRWLNLAAV